MKILLIGQLPMEIGGNYTTGAANVVYELGKQSFSDVTYYTYGTNISYKKAIKESSYPLQYIGYKIEPLKMLLYAMRHPILSLRHWKHYCRTDHQNFIRYAFYEYNIRKAINLINPDLIHVNSIDNVSPVRFALDKKKIPVLLTCHGIFYRGDIKDIIHRDRALGNIHLADAYSGLTKEALNEYESILGIPQERVSIIPNGVNCRKFYFSNNERIKIRKELSVQDACKVFLTVASVQNRKGQLAFLDILSQLGLEDYQYWIIGKGPDEEEIQKYIDKKGIQSNVKLLGYRTANELYRYYSAADIYAHSSWREGQALSEIEAYATGLRTIVNKSIIGTIARDVDSNDCYILDFDKIDVESLKKWISQDQNGRSSRTTFDWKLIAEKYHNLYHKIVSNR